MHTPKHSSEAPSDFFEDLKNRREAGESLAEAEENYCLALEAGYDTYVADLIYMKADGQSLSIGEEIYLEAKFDGNSDDEALEMAEKATVGFSGRYSEFLKNPSGEWEKVVEDFREEFFNTPGKKTYEEAIKAGLDELTADLMAQQAEGTELSPADLAYLNARRAGHSEYVAELLSRQASGNAMEPDEAAYLEAKLQGFSDEQADLVADSVRKTVSRVRLGLDSTPLN